MKRINFLIGLSLAIIILAVIIGILIPIQGGLNLWGIEALIVAIVASQATIILNLLTLRNYLRIIEFLKGDNNERNHYHS